MEKFTKKKKQQLENFLQLYIGVFYDPKWIPPRREVEHEIQLFPNSRLPNIGLYR
jgi:hypothetical protein